MSRKYKFYNKQGLYFISFATVYWIDVFVRDLYFSKVIESLDYCRKHKGMEIYCWCIMPSHIHLIIRAKEGKPEVIIGRFKEYTSKKLQECIEENMQESRKAWILWMLERAGTKSSNVKNKQFWQHNNKPIELWSSSVIDQKVDYIHNNPVESGFVREPWHWKYSSAIDYSGGRGILEIDFIYICVGDKWDTRGTRAPAGITGRSSPCRLPPDLCAFGAVPADINVFPSF